MRFRASVLLPAFLTAGLICLASEGLAEDAFTVRDTNADGVLSGREAKGLKVLDKDGDDEISESEFRNSIASWHKQVAETDDANFKVMDRNEDERLSGNETKNYEFCDLNNDGRITRKEYDQALADRRLALAALSAEQLQLSADEYFRILDVNEDGRISGTESAGLNRYDTDSDGRISKEECSHGTLMDALSASAPVAQDTVPDPAPDSVPAMADNPIQWLTDAANSQTTDTLLANMRPELVGLMDEVILQYIVEFVHKHHGRIQAVPASQIQSKKGDNPEQTEFSASVRCAKGKLRLIATLYEDKLLGLQYESPAIDQLDSELYKELGDSLGQEDGLTARFAKFYSPMCRQLINSVLESKDDEAFAMFHPSIQAQLGKDAFVTVFELMREKCGTEYKIEMESFVVEEDKDGDHSFKLSHRVTGLNPPQILTAGFQIVGMKAALVSIAIAPAEGGDADAKPTTLAQLINDAWNKLDSDAKSDSPAKSMKRIDASRDGLTFQMPGQPQRKVDESGNVSWELDNSGALYSAMIMSFDFDLEAQSTVFLDGLKNVLPEKFMGELVEAEEMKWHEHPGQMIRINLPDGRQVHRRDVVIGQTSYSLQLLSADTSEEFRTNIELAFLKSFKDTKKTDDDTDSPAAVAPPSSPSADPPVPAPLRLD